MTRCKCGAAVFARWAEAYRGQLQRLRTGWRDVSSSVIFELKNGEGLRFDNLAYVQE